MDERTAADAVTIIGLRDELRTIIADRDRLRKRVLDLEQQSGDRERHLRDALKDVRAERDRLRAVVDAQRYAIYARNCYISADTDEERDASGRMMEVARERLLQLDGSEAMGGAPSAEAQDG